jgi:hypothetical protein
MCHSNLLGYILAGQSGGLGIMVRSRFAMRKRLQWADNGALSIQA